MNVLILGAGQVGLGVANYLRNHNAEVAIVEKSPELAFDIRNSSNINVVQGDALNAEVLKNANAENASHLIATMSNDEQNIVACKLAGSFFNIGIKIARTRSHSFLRNNIFELFLKDNFGIDALIHPELEVAKYISDVALLNGAFDVIKLSQTTIVGIKCQDNTDIINTTFKHFQGITDLNLFVLTITRAGETFFPTGNDLLLPNDEVYVAMDSAKIPEVLAMFGHRQGKQNFFVVGGGSVGAFTMKMISAQSPDSNITVLEKSKEKAEEISQEYPYATTIMGDALNYDLLREISSGIDTAIVSTDHDAVNVLSSLLMKQFQVKRILTLAKSKSYDSLLPISSGCSVINPSAITIETIIQKSRNGKIISAIPLKNQTARVMEVEVTESFTGLEESLESLWEKDRVIPVFVIRNGGIIPARKDTILQLDDRLIILAAKDCVNSVEKSFSNYLFSKN
ncbi:MAG: Trk system potassium transporter TrkA [Holosporaceae bacterium]|jgi:trk system potassium uptake protein TrkA|nr:Trk system potassium transporter TrkA [Holosporaceae bacterium]